MLKCFDECQGSLDHFNNYALPLLIGVLETIQNHISKVMGSRKLPRIYQTEINVFPLGDFFSLPFCTKCTKLPSKTRENKYDRTMRPGNGRSSKRCSVQRFKLICLATGILKPPYSRQCSMVTCQIRNSRPPLQLAKTINLVLVFP